MTARSYPQATMRGREPTSPRNIRVACYHSRLPPSLWAGCAVSTQATESAQLHQSALVCQVSPMPFHQCTVAGHGTYQIPPCMSSHTARSKKDHVGFTAWGSRINTLYLGCMPRVHHASLKAHIMSPMGDSANVSDQTCFRPLCDIQIRLHRLL